MNPDREGGSVAEGIATHALAGELLGQSLVASSGATDEELTRFAESGDLVLDLLESTVQLANLLDQVTECGGDDLFCHAVDSS